MPAFSRRDFLRLSALVPASTVLFPWLSNLVLPQKGRQETKPQNTLIFLFDSMTAKNLSLYGYPRDTTPNFNRFASRANVYHSHYSAGNFTIPGTTSLLTGLYPWTHRAINEGGVMTRELVDRNIFRSMGDRYNRLIFAQNIWANFILNQFGQDINIRLSPASFSAANGIVGSWFQNDPAGYHSFDDFLFKSSNTGSLVFGTFQRLYALRRIKQAREVHSVQYPIGLPQTDNYPLLFSLEDVFNGLIDSVNKINVPTFAYFHLFPPHEPYRPTQDFSSMFNDKYRPLDKPTHPLSHNVSRAFLIKSRKSYDQFLANIDLQFGRLLDTLERSGFLDNSVVVVTSDHGESFERGEQGHETPMMYDPVLRIPLLISTPQQNTRNDIYDPTNSVDVLPTLVHLAGQTVPEWCEGELLPGLGGEYDPQRSTFSVEAKENSAHAPLNKVTIAMRKGSYKLIHYVGYENGFGDAYELYNLENDPEEMMDLFQSEQFIGTQMKDELLNKLNESNSHFRS